MTTLDVLVKDIFEDANVKDLAKLQNQQNQSNSSVRRRSSIASSVSLRDQEFMEVEANIMVSSYAPQVFKFIRCMDGVQDSEIMESIDPKNNRGQIFKTNKGKKHNSGGKSGSFFFFTEDRKFIIKTLQKKEKKKLLAMLPDMVNYIKSGTKNNGSLLSFIYGIYRVKMPGVTPIFLIL